jgi:hypothetical protein
LRSPPRGLLGRNDLWQPIQVREFIPEDRYFRDSR